MVTAAGLTKSLADQVRDTEARHVMQTYKRAPIVLVKGEGARVWDSEGRAYLVSKISVLSQPFPDADIAADRFQTYLCSCPAFYFQESNGLETNETHPTDIGKCKHVLAAFKHERAKQDENQSELIE